MREKIPLEMATRLLNHGPLVLISSTWEDKIDVTPVAWHMPVSKVPPIIAFTISEEHFIYKCILKSKEFAVNIPSPGIIREIIQCGTESGADVDKLRMTGLSTELPRVIKAPVLKTAIAVLECTLLEDKYLLEHYNIVLGEVKYAEIEPLAFDGHWLFKDQDLKTVHHLGDMTFVVPADDVIDLR